MQSVIKIEWHGEGKYPCHLVYLEQHKGRKVTRFLLDSFSGHSRPGDKPEDGRVRSHASASEYANELGHLLTIDVVGA